MLSLLCTPPAGVCWRSACTSLTFRLLRSSGSSLEACWSRSDSLRSSCRRSLSPAFYAVWRVLSGATARPTRLVSQWKQQSRRGWLELVAASAIPSIAVTVIFWRVVPNPRGGPKGLAWLLPLAFLITLLAVLLGLNLRARLVATYGESACSWNAVRPVVYMSLVVALVFAPICFLFAGALSPFRGVKVCTTNGRPVRGVLVGETGDRTYVGQRGVTGKEKGKRLAPRVLDPSVRDHSDDHRQLPARAREVPAAGTAQCPLIQAPSLLRL